MIKIKCSALKELTCRLYSGKNYLRDTLVGSVVQDGGYVLETWSLLTNWVSSPRAQLTADTGGIAHLLVE